MDGEKVQSLFVDVHLSDLIKIFDGLVYGTMCHFEIFFTVPKIKLVFQNLNTYSLLLTVFCLSKKSELDQEK